MILLHRTVLIVRSLLVEVEVVEVAVAVAVVVSLEPEVAPLAEVAVH